MTVLTSSSMQKIAKRHRSKRHHKSSCQADEDYQEGVQVRHGRSPRRVRAHSEQNREPSARFLDRRKRQDDQSGTRPTPPGFALVLGATFLPAYAENESVGLRRAQRAAEGLSFQTSRSLSSLTSLTSSFHSACDSLTMFSSSPIVTPWSVISTSGHSEQCSHSETLMGFISASRRWTGGTVKGLRQFKKGTTIRVGNMLERVM